jgi:hypothetical protein
LRPELRPELSPLITPFTRRLTPAEWSHVCFGTPIWVSEAGEVQLLRTIPAPKP